MINIFIQSNISHLFTQLNHQTVLLQAIQFSISHLFAFNLNVKQFYWTLFGATTLGQSGPGNNGTEEVLYIPQSSSITGASPSERLML